ncbi:winged helix-turn-helix transcriptional regulator [Zobellia alginiliquefaciens]|uniref:winged helix-turn-helix transcriptional regulator n=1 Tax=Zobellia alginiliquefaciens TaxID=3032586 RepID=UPI0023E3F596|nr:helix-turn-helix domain-containing protein [Zobellia alginiliquefaciens]
MEEQKRRSDCPITLSLDIFGDKWTLLILRDFIFFDNRHFNQLVNIERISTNILTDRLNRLLANGIIKKEVDLNNRSAYLYSLTKKGLDLVPIVMDIYRWGANYTEKNNAEKEFKKKIDSDYDKTVEEIKNRLITTHNIGNR